MYLLNSYYVPSTTPRALQNKSVYCTLAVYQVPCPMKSKSSTYLYAGHSTNDGMTVNNSLLNTYYVPREQQ